jgi:hypothetical protein
MPLSDEHEHPHELHGHMEEEPLRLEDLTPEHFSTSTLYLLHLLHPREACVSSMTCPIDISSTVELTG